MDAPLEGIWLFGSLLTGICVVSGNANSWSLVAQSQPWYALAERGLLTGGILYLVTLVVRFSSRRRG